MNIRCLVYGMTIILMSGCAATPKVSNEKGAADPGSQKNDLYSPEGMTQAMLEIEADIGTGKLRTIAALYERSYRLDPKNPYKRFLWAYALEDRNEAWNELTKITKLDDRFFWTYLGMAIILDEWKVFDQAEKNFQTAVNLDPNSALGADRFGRMFLHKGDPLKALPLLKTAVKQEPRQTTYLLDLARAERDTDQASDAITSYRSVITISPELFAAHAELAELLAKTGNNGEALEEYRKAASFDERTFEVCGALAALLADQGRLEESAEAYRVACPLKPAQVECWRTLATLAAKLDKRDLRVQAFEQVIKIEPEDLEAHRFLATAYLQAGEIEKALPSFQQWHAKLPNDTDALLGLAEIYERGEDPSKALESYERLLELQPGLDRARQARSRLFERFSIQSEPISGVSPQQVFAKNQEHIDRLYKARLKDNPRLQGDLVLKVKVNNLGRVEEVLVSKDTVGDSVIGTSAFWNLRRAKFPKGMGATYSFSLSLKPAH